MRIDLYESVEVSSPVSCSFCKSQIGRDDRCCMTERCEYYCSVRCAEQSYIFTFDELQIIDASNMVQLVFEEKNDG